MLRLAERAAGLRKQARKREPAHQDNTRGVPMVSVDTQDLGDKRLPAVGGPVGGNGSKVEGDGSDATAGDQGNQGGNNEYR